MASPLDKVKAKIASVSNFPKHGIMFRDITPLLQDVEAREIALDEMSKLVTKDMQADIIAGLDARGFLFGLAIATRLKLPFVMIRKPSKMPNTISVDYALEYGTNTLEVQQGAIPKGSKVVLVDDLLATGGSLLAANALVEKCGAKTVAAMCLIELDGLQGRKVSTEHAIFFFHNQFFYSYFCLQ